MLDPTTIAAITSHITTLSDLLTILLTRPDLGIPKQIHLISTQFQRIESSTNNYDKDARKELVSRLCQLMLTWSEIKQSVLPTAAAMKIITLISASTLWCTDFREWSEEYIAANSNAIRAKDIGATIATPQIEGSTDISASDLAALPLPLSPSRRRVVSHILQMLQPQFLSSTSATPPLLTTQLALIDLWTRQPAACTNVKETMKVVMQWIKSTDNADALQAMRDWYREVVRSLSAQKATTNASPSAASSSAASAATPPQSSQSLVPHRRNPHDKCGLDNLGNSCYMNSVLQSLFMTDRFRSDLLHIDRQDNFTFLRSHNSLMSLQTIFTFLLTTHRSSYAPRTFHQSLPEMFRELTQQDAGEFAKYVLDKVGVGMKKFKEHLKEKEKEKERRREEQKMLLEGKENDDGGDAASSSASASSAASTSTALIPSSSSTTALPALPAVGTAPLLAKVISRNNTAVPMDLDDGVRGGAAALPILATVVDELAPDSNLHATGTLVPPTGVEIGVSSAVSSSLASASRVVTDATPAIATAASSSTPAFDMSADEYFGGQFLSTITCLTCGTCSTKTEPFLELPLALEIEKAPPTVTISAAATNSSSSTPSAAPPASSSSSTVVTSSTLPSSTPFVPALAHALQLAQDDADKPLTDAISSVAATTTEATSRIDDILAGFLGDETAGVDENEPGRRMEDIVETSKPSEPTPTTTAQSAIASEADAAAAATAATNAAALSFIMNFAQQAMMAAAVVTSAQQTALITSAQQAALMESSKTNTNSIATTSTTHSTVNAAEVPLPDDSPIPITSAFNHIATSEPPASTASATANIVADAAASSASSSTSSISALSSSSAASSTSSSSSSTTASSSSSSPSTTVSTSSSSSSCPPAPTYIVPTGPLHLSAMLDHYFSSEELSGSNAYACSHCMQKRTSMKQLSLIRPTPQHLLICLKRNKYEMNNGSFVRNKIMKEVLYPCVLKVPILDVNESTIPKRPLVESKVIYRTYVLYSVIFHSGTSAQQGHYYTISRHSDRDALMQVADLVGSSSSTSGSSSSPSSDLFGTSDSSEVDPALEQAAQGGSWYCCNDSYVTPSSFKSITEVTKSNPTHVAYLLFYRALDAQSVAQAQTSVKMMGADLTAGLTHYLLTPVTQDNNTYEKEQSAMVQIARVLAMPKPAYIAPNQTSVAKPTEQDGGYDADMA